MARRLFIIVTLALSASCVLAVDSDKGFLERPPLFVDNEHDFPLAGMGIEVPRAGKTIPDFDALTVQSQAFNSDGTNVQPQLGLKFDVERIGAVHGFKDGWAAGVSVAFQRTHARGLISGQQATGIVNALGDTTLAAKKVLWTGARGQRLVAVAGFELPTGKSNATFGDSNPVTNAYYRNFPRRMPISWQPGSGTVNGYLGVAYGRSRNRLSYEGILATKLHSSGDEDVKIGDIFMAAATTTYGIGRNFAASLGLTLRVQADDSYPNALLPGIGQPALVGTTQHGTTLYIDPSFRVNVLKGINIGVGFRIPAVKPDNGMVPDTRVFLIIYPNL